MDILNIKSSKDLETTHSAILKGFLDQAMAKSEKAEPYIKEALAFYKAIKKCDSLEDVLGLHDHRKELVAACGFSDKSKSKFTITELDDSLVKILGKIVHVSNDNFREEIIFRYLLTKGDSLGGSMRNLTGSLATEKIQSKVLNALNSEGTAFELEKSKSGKVQAIQWKNRIIFFDATPDFIRKNIDIILLQHQNQNHKKKELLSNPNLYLACGELKGGIDPAGADEHWKTANSALERIRASFSKITSHPSLFFVGAAIETAMAKEIFEQLRNGKLSFAANLTKQGQVDEMVEWLLSL